MHASVFQIDLGASTSVVDRGRSGRDLATVLGAVPGFIAFLALETEDSAACGLCICMDAATLDQAHRVAETWQRERAEPGGAPIRPLVTGKVIVQRGF